MAKLPHTLLTPTPHRIIQATRDHLTAHPDQTAAVLTTTAVPGRVEAIISGVCLGTGFRLVHRGPGPGPHDVALVFATSVN